VALEQKSLETPELDDRGQWFQKYCSKPPNPNKGCKGSKMRRAKARLGLYMFNVTTACLCLSVVQALEKSRLLTFIFKMSLDSLLLKTIRTTIIFYGVEAWVARCSNSEVGRAQEKFGTADLAILT